MTRNIVSPPGKYLWQELFKSPQALIFFLIHPPFQNLGLKVVPPAERKGTDTMNTLKANQLGLCPRYQSWDFVILLWIWPRNKLRRFVFSVIRLEGYINLLTRMLLHLPSTTVVKTEDHEDWCAPSHRQNKSFVNTSKKLLQSKNQTFPIVHYLTRKLELISNILWMIVSGNLFLIVTSPRPLQT